jgi:nicotinamide mononucleotide transporter
MWDIFSVNTVFWQIGNYPLSYIEFVGTLLYFLSTWLISRKNILTWPVGIVSVILYGILFYQIRLYSDMLEQVYYFVICIIGWITWQKQKNTTHTIPTAWSKLTELGFWLSITIVASTILAFGVSHFHLWLPKLFPEPASYPVLDALTTVMSFIAMYLTTIRRNEGWIYWIIVDSIGVGLYWVKDVKFIAIQYVFLLGMGAYGLWYWLRKQERLTSGEL